MPPYNLTGIVNNATMLKFVQGVNTELMAGTLGVVFLFGLSALLFTSFYATSQDGKTSVLVTSLIIFLLALPLKALSLIPTLAVFIPAVAFSIALVLKD